MKKAKGKPLEVILIDILEELKDINKKLDARTSRDLDITIDSNKIVPTVISQLNQNSQ